MRGTPAERFWSKVEVDACGCWLWTGGRVGHGGYGAFWLDGRQVTAHIWSFLFFGGAIPAGYQLDHVRARGCRHKHCVNPAHLEAVTPWENTHRAPTAPARLNRDKTHCPQGHAYAGANLRVISGRQSQRVCVECSSAAGLRWRQKRRASA